MTTHELQSKAIVATVQNVLDKYKLNPKSLILEIPETAQVNSINDTNASLVALKGIGVDVAADSFGRDYLSLASLRNSLVNMVKIDKNLFINDNDEFSQTLAKSIIELAHCRNIKVCVKGVELDEEQEKILKYNADLSHGYLISEPLTELEMKNFTLNTISQESAR